MKLDWFLERAARVLNRRIAESVSAARLAEELDGRSCRLHVEGLDLGAVLRVEGRRLTVVSDPNAAADVAIEGPPLELLRLTGSDAPRRIQESGARLTGEIRIAQRFADLLRLAAPDPEEELADWVGNVAAHALGEAARGAAAWMRRAGDALRDDAAEYLKEESRVLPTPHEAEAFYADVDRLRDDVERAAARIDRLARGLGAG